MNTNTKITVGVCVVVAISIYFIYNELSQLREEHDEQRTELLKLRSEVVKLRNLKNVLDSQLKHIDDFESDISDISDTSVDSEESIELQEELELEPEPESEFEEELPMVDSFDIEENKPYFIQQNIQPENNTDVIDINTVDQMSFKQIKDAIRSFGDKTVSLKGAKNELKDKLLSLIRKNDIQSE